MSWWKSFKVCILSEDNESILALLNKVSIKTASDREGNNLLHYVAKTNNKFLANYLMEAGCDINLKNNNNTTPLMVAIKCNQVVMVRLLVKAGANLEEINENGHTPLQISLLCHRDNTKSKNFKIIKVLIKAGSNVNKILFSNRGSYETLLHYVIRNKYHDVLNLLLNAGARLDEENIKGLRPLHCAIKYNDYESIKKLINAGAEVDYADWFNCTYLHQAAEKFLPDILELLLDNGVNINALNCHGETALLCCLSKDSYIYLYNFIDADIDLSLEYEEPSKTQQKIKCVQILLERGTNASLKGNHGSALYIAIMCHHSKIVNLLIEHGATFDYNNDDDRFALKKCINYKNLVELIKNFVLSEAQNLKEIKVKFYPEFLKEQPRKGLNKRLFKLYLLCSRELNKMKDKKIHNSVSLFQLLIKKNFRSYMRNENIIHVLISNKQRITTRYPFYGPMIYVYFENEFAKQPLLNAAALGLSIILQCTNYSLPLIFDKILNFLNETDLKNLASLV